MSNFQGYAFHPEKQEVMIAQFIDDNSDDDAYSVCFSDSERYPLLEVVVVSKREDGSHHLMLKGYGGTLSPEFHGYMLADESLAYSGKTLEDACKAFSSVVLDLVKQEDESGE